MVMQLSANKQYDCHLDRVDFLHMHWSSTIKSTVAFQPEGRDGCVSINPTRFASSNTALCSELNSNRCSCRARRSAASSAVPNASKNGQDRHHSIRNIVHTIQ